MRASVVVCCCAAVAFLSYAKQRGEQGVAWRLTDAGVVEWSGQQQNYETIIKRNRKRLFTSV